ncbi:peptide ABC transporter substrate-binding protein [Ktedonosporobacter rubrisoli]|uniref:Peptide ABC transporter substrate-binding protein n=1 Tax=Ktedonosporobacter rubrisoli TaxID=2509675 RepID=A0A4P6K2R9_KTERU|nr:peptide ABC transporter substrate-binding protein [Ktedonosporobacter rubrisoli]QBD82212.1 peptide ABC transporter substrate-binding protein [Ktedonosporobacter rubrisoli]
MPTGKNLSTRLLPPLLCLLAMLVVACGGSNPSPGQSNAVTKAPDNKQIYVYPISGVADIKTFDPAMSLDIRSIQAISMVYTGLVGQNDKLEIVDQLAQSHEVASDGVTWTFKLKPNLKFSDGTPLTSQDVVYSINRALDPALKSVRASSYLGLIKDADKFNSGKIKTLIGDSLMAPDPNTVVIVTGTKAAYFLDTLSYSTSYVVEKSLVDKYGNSKFTDHLTEGGGAGPWMVGKYDHNTGIDFVPNPNYYGPKPQMKKVVFPFYKAADTPYKDYQINRLSYALVPTAQLKEAKALPNGQYHPVPQLDIYYFAMNYLTKPFDNIKIRQAFALALNKDLIANKVYEGAAIPTNHIIPEGMPGYNPNLTGPGGVKDTKGDPEMAKKLFQEGLKEEGLTLSTLPPITVNVSTEGSQAARNEIAVEQQMWQSVLGVSVKINDIEFSKLLDDIGTAQNSSKGLMMWYVDWIADYPDPQDWTTLLFDKGSSQNNMNYGQNNTPQAAQQQANQKLMEQADINQNQTERMQQYNQVEQQMVNDVAWLPVYQNVQSIVRKPCVVGMTDVPTIAPPPDDWANVYISTATPCADTSSYQ